MSFFLREQPTFTELSHAGIEWEECPCLLCGGDQSVPLVESPDRSVAAGKWFLVVQCQDCGLCFTNPRPSQRSLPQFQSRNDGLNRHFSEERPGKIAPGRWRLPGASRYRRAMPPFGQGRLLDVGCGSGSFLGRMHRQGWLVQGLDTSEMAVERVRDDLELPAKVGSLPNALLRSGSIDLITMWQSLQRMPWPLEALKDARRLLAPGGKLIVAVPNIDSLPFRWFGQAWNGLELPRHLTHFAPWTLTHLLQMAGFRPGPVRMVRRGRWLRASANLACRFHPAVPSFLRWLQKKTPSHLGTWFSYLTRQSDCIMVTAEV